jgi:translation initiation factor IF-1
LLISAAVRLRDSDSAAMNHESRIGTVTRQLPSGLYEVEIEGPRRITAHAASGPEKNFIRLLVGDQVIVELAPRDLGRGRIVRKA